MRKFFLPVLALIAGCLNAQTPQKQLPRNLHPVRPVESRGAGGAGQSLPLRSGSYFSYALPQGWRVAEEGQFALTLLAADSKALTVMVGNAGVPINYPAGRFVSEKLSAIRPQNLQLGQGRPATPLAGFAQAVEFDVHYSIQGAPCQGKAKVNIAPAYDSALMVMTAALSEARQWPSYAAWLPLVGEQISATNGAAFGKRGVMAQNLKNSQEYGEATRRYREWSQKNWQGVVDDRNQSVDRRNTQVRENLGGIQTYDNPFGAGKTVELPTTYKYFWTDGQGNYVGSDDPSENPNVGSTREWRKMPRRQ